jgi:glycosyltransferase involved in cell wall biosynthesis
VIGHTVWETTAIPSHWRALLNMVDHLIVPCAWNKKVFQEGGVTVPISVVPHIVEVPIAASTCPPADNDGYVFYTIGTWTHRKSLFYTVKAYCEAFTAADPTTLIIKTAPRDFTATGLLHRFSRSTADALKRLTRQYRNPPRIRLITDELSESEIRRLHQRGDCYVSLCRTEGWGIGAFDAASYGNPVVMTGFGGQLDYLDPNLSYLIGYELVPVINPSAPRSYSPDQRWAEPDIEHGAAMLREVMARPDAAKARACRLQSRILERFSARPVSDCLLTTLDRVRA